VGPVGPALITGDAACLLGVVPFPPCDKPQLTNERSAHGYHVCHSLFHQLFRTVEAHYFKKNYNVIAILLDNRAKQTYLFQILKKNFMVTV
jgi:hypothetical protein